MKTAEIHLPYFKQGDDLGHCLDHCPSIEEALEQDAVNLEGAASILRQIKNMVKGHKVEMQADTHYISISGEDDLIDALIKEELAYLDPFEDEEDEDWEEEDGEEEGEEE
jgi:hypothetical protein